MFLKKENNSISVSENHPGCSADWRKNQIQGDSWDAAAAIQAEAEAEKLERSGQI